MSGSASGVDNFRAPGPKIGSSALAPNPLHRSNALECVDFRLVEGPEDVERAGFAPTFAHQHFGDDETILGYPGLRISHFYSCGSLQLHTRISFAEKEPGAIPEDIGAKLRFYMPDEDCEPESAWSAPSIDAVLERVRLDIKNNWTPPGEQISSYTSGPHTFQVRRANIADPGMREYWQRMRPFLIWFVDAANYFDDTDERWDVFMLFQEPKSPGGALRFCGFATCYNFFAWGGSGRAPGQPKTPEMERFTSAAGPKVVSPAVEEIVSSFVTNSYSALASGKRPWYDRRVRVSQFLILPPWQRAGHGAHLFETMCQWSRSFYSPLRDITVEDPSPGFVSMRDFCDLKFLMDQGLLRAEDRRHNHEAIISALKERRNVCQPQIDRIVRLIKFLEAVTPEQKQAVRLEIKKILYKENSADIEADQVKEAVEELWLQEEASFNATLLRLKLIN